MQNRVRPLPAVIAGLLVIAVWTTGAQGQSTVPTTTTGQSTSTTESPCPVPSAAGTAIASEPINPPITFDASQKASTTNFGEDRDPENVEFKLTTVQPLPKDVEKTLELVADPIVRVGATTDSASFPEPRFSVLRVSRNRKTLTFRVCLAPAKNLPAGKYTGTITLEGPPGVESTGVTVTANAKDGFIFWGAAILMAALALLILLYKGANDERARLKAEAEAMPDESDGKPTTAKTAKLNAAKKWKAPALTTVKDPGWVFPTVFAIVAAFGVLWGTYDANPSWGEAGRLSSAFAVIGTGLAAIGAKTVLTPSGK